MEGVALAVNLAAEGDLHLARALAPQSPPGPSLAHPAPTPAAALAPTRDPGPEVDPDLLGVALAPDPDHIHIRLQRDAMVPKSRALLLSHRQWWLPLPPNHVQITG